MKKVLYGIVGILTLASCASSFNITGTTNVSTLDGRKLYLKVAKDTTLRDVDSCDVVHGQFQFSGVIDSVRVGSIVIEDAVELPVVLESGDIQVKIDNTQETVSGTPLNDKLSKFFTKYTQLVNQGRDLVHQHDQAIMNGSNMEEVNARLQEENDSINERLDRLVTAFVTDNFDNVLGPYVFLNVCASRYQVPMLDSWVEYIMSKATDKFKNDANVKAYYEAAQENQDILNGTKEPAGAPTATPPADGPTPNQMAAPADGEQAAQP